MAYWNYLLIQIIAWQHATSQMTHSDGHIGHATAGPTDMTPHGGGMVHDNVSVSMPDAQSSNHSSMWNMTEICSMVQMCTSHSNHNTGTNQMNTGGHDPNAGSHDPNAGGHDPNAGGHDPNAQGHGGHSSAVHNMLMYFNVNNTLVENILFKEWTVKNWKEMVGSCVGLAVVAVLYEGLKLLREQLQRKYNRRSSYKLAAEDRNSCSCSRVCMHGLQVFLHMVQVFLSYCLMLVFMTYNGWLCISVVVGAGIGYMIFGWSRTGYSDEGDHCN